MHRVSALALAVALTLTTAVGVAAARPSAIAASQFSAYLGVQTAATQPAGTATVPLVVVTPGRASTVSARRGVSPQTNPVYGACGWASVYIYQNGHANAEFTANAGSSLGPIVTATWSLSWNNLDDPPYGDGWSGTTYQFSPTWGVTRYDYTGQGDIESILGYLKVILWDGTQCTGLRPWVITYIF